jgi:Carboxypeptidase regulatory-like domain
VARVRAAALPTRLGKMRRGHAAERTRQTGCTFRQVGAKHSYTPGKAPTSQFPLHLGLAVRALLSTLAFLPAKGRRAFWGEDPGAQKRDGNMKRAAIMGIVLSLAVLASQRASAAPQGGVLSGVVIGPDDKPVPHAVITYQSGGGIAPHVVHADARGHFSIAKLRSDVYALRASGKGVFSDWENIAVRSGKTRAVTLRLIYAKRIPKGYTATRTYEPDPKP